MSQERAINKAVTIWSRSGSSFSSVISDYFRANPLYQRRVFTQAVRNSSTRLKHFDLKVGERDTQMRHRTNSIAETQ
ncbi:hypothetical protein M378DRAFT_1016809 [Amanita muscaria Koide BX008]|uniref:Uncharacterized protein n=1 Tax=Amanita muscaria (strain Koide BX008) TaxID=946122 RepID=A0A0C2WS85_AMAMK|nr:hypothetical protein M378DRAFT_1016809 [Amanita muscaria Koide BX008]